MVSNHIRLEQWFEPFWACGTLILLKSLAAYQSVIEGPKWWLKCQNLHTVSGIILFGVTPRRIWQHTCASQRTGWETLVWRMATRLDTTVLYLCLTPRPRIRLYLGGIIRMAFFFFSFHLIFFECIFLHKVFYFFLESCWCNKKVFFSLLSSNSRRCMQIFSTISFFLGILFRWKG